MQINEEGLDLIRRYEGCKLKAYKCPAGVWTIGFGTTTGVHEGMQITFMEADKLFRIDVQNVAEAVHKLLEITLTDQQFSAVVSLVYNIGIGAFTHSTMLIRLNENKLSEAAEQFLQWDKIHGMVSSGLLNRRMAERDLFEC